MIAGVVNEATAGERRVAVVPAVVTGLAKSGINTLIETGAGSAAGFSDEQYRVSGAEIAASRSDVFARCDIVTQVQTCACDVQQLAGDFDLLRREQVLVGLMEPMTDRSAVERLAGTGVTGFAMELIPRITRAQSMDVLSSQANIAGYKAVVLAADQLPKLFPMMMTAAGTITPARVFVIGAGVAGLQAIATARRLGGVVTAYDIRPAVKEQIESLGATFFEIKVEVEGAEDRGGYAKEVSKSVLSAQQQQMSDAIAASDVVITTAAVPGRPAPKLISADMVRRMKPGSVIVDIAAERGGNCELTRPGETIVENGVTIVGSRNFPALAPHDASQMYARNIMAFLKHLVDKDGSLKLDGDDEIIRDTMLVRGGEIVNKRVREIFDLAPLQTSAQEVSS